MQYLIRGRLLRAQEILRLPHEEYVQLIASKIVPALKMLVGENAHGKVLGGGAPAGSRDIVMILDLRATDSHRCVRQFLTSLPMFEYYEWEAVPLETLEEMAKTFGA